MEHTFGDITMLQDQMDQIYKRIPAANIPWNFETLPDILNTFVQSHITISGKIIELGCGAGNYVIALAKMGYNVTGVDFSRTAIELANNTARQHDVQCNFITADVLSGLDALRETFDFVYDWELLHHFFPDAREKYISSVDRLLNPGSHYLSVCFSDNSAQFGGSGKIRKTPLETELYFSSEDEIASLLTPFFNIIELKTVDIQGKFGIHKAIYVVSSK